MANQESIEWTDIAHAMDQDKGNHGWNLDTRRSGLFGHAQHGGGIAGHSEDDPE